MSSIQEPHIDVLTDEEELSLERIERSLLKQLEKVKERRERAVRAANDAPVELEVIEVGKDKKEENAKKKSGEEAKVEKKGNEEKETEEKACRGKEAEIQKEGEKPGAEDVISIDLNEVESGEEDMYSRAAHSGKVRSALWESVLNTEAKQDYQAAVRKNQGSCAKKRAFNELEPPAWEEEKQMGRSEEKGWPNSLSSGWPVPQPNEGKPLAKWPERAKKAEAYERNSGELRQMLQRMFSVQQKANDIQNEAHEAALTIKRILGEMKEPGEPEGPGKDGPPTLAEDVEQAAISPDLQRPRQLQL
ncbi:hypothetical protein GPALN_004230 [Globodera pallida]|nr:hypothetical protein GPALN_004230 [Globodera pallida]